MGLTSFMLGQQDLVESIWISTNRRVQCKKSNTSWKDIDQKAK
jgi:hypothetical protein